MSVTDQYWADVLALPSFAPTVRELSVRSVVASLPNVSRSEQAWEVDWNRAVFVASLVTADASEPALDGALRISQGCFQDPASDTTHRTAARVLLERLGNRRSVDLALSKHLLTAENDDVLSAPMELDVIRRTIQFTIDAADGETFRVNAFQQAFWEAAQYSDWLSVSAPTSAGKSYIVKQWLREQLVSRQRMIAVYLVPTRALIEEVSGDLRSSLKGVAEVHTLPWDRRIGSGTKEVFVLTQERLHVLQYLRPDFQADLLFIDEAQKFGDDSRGVLLQRVVAEAVHRRPDAQVMFASPLTSNPEILIAGSTGRATQITSELVTVNQNLIYVEQVRGKPLQWTATMAVHGELVAVGNFELPARANTASKRLPLVAVALGGDEAGNVVYANTASDAEKMAQQIFDALGPEADVSDNDEIADLRELIVRTIHPQYALQAHLARGVAFHYGNMPLLIRQQIESLFRNGTLRYLVCTSTLLEGVNLPCRNLFVRAPRKGKGNPMTVADFWNLAGRAGRWGIEFQGNIVCVDAADPALWPNRPFERVRQPIKRATDGILADWQALMQYCREGTPLEMSKAKPGVESLYSLLASNVRNGRGLSGLSWLTTDQSATAALETVVSESLEGVTLPESLTSKHAGISPLSMQRLHDACLEHPDPTRLELLLPEDAEAVEHLIRAIVLVDGHLGGSFGPVPGRHWQLSILIVKWMRGMPLAVLIADRVNWARKNRPKTSVASVIRSVMNDVEQMARFEAPLYLACYSEILSLALNARGMTSIGAGLPDIAMMLELGVSRMTEVSMMSLGLSRTTTVALSEYVIADDLSPDECLVWLRENDVSTFDLPSLVIREIQTVIATNGPAGDAA
jgi:hypothetical protein